MAITLVESSSLLTLTTIQKLPLSEYTTTLLFQLITKELLSWFCWISHRRLIPLIIGYCVQDCQLVLGFVTWHLTGSFPTYLAVSSSLKSMMVFLMFKVLFMHGVPRGPVPGPMLYSLYTTPLGDIASSHGLSYHF